MPVSNEIISPYPCVGCSGMKTDLLEIMKIVFANGDPGGIPDRVVLFSRFDDDAWDCLAFFFQDNATSCDDLVPRVNGEDLDTLFHGQDNELRWNRNSGSRPPGDELWKSLGFPPPSRNLVACRTKSVGAAAIDFRGWARVRHVRVVSALVSAFGFFLKISVTRVEEVERAFLYTIGALARAAELHDEDTGNHIVRVGKYSEELARTLGCDPAFTRTIAYSAQMHDVGKLHVHPDILKKPGRLSREEWEEMKKHTVYGLRILGDDPRLDMAREVALAHHERWNGQGYPYGLRGENIPLSARIVAVADVYDALRCARTYKPPFEHEETIKIIVKGDDRSSPNHFDPRVLEAFGDIHRLMKEIYLSLE